MHTARRRLRFAKGDFPQGARPRGPDAAARFLPSALPPRVDAPGQPARATVESQFDNDTDALVPGSRATDRNYTLGTRTVWYGLPGALPHGPRRAAERFGVERGARSRLALAFGLRYIFSYTSRQFRERNDYQEYGSVGALF